MLVLAGIFLVCFTIWAIADDYFYYKNEEMKKELIKKALEKSEE